MENKHFYSSSLDSIMCYPAKYLFPPLRKLCCQQNISKCFSRLPVALHWFLTAAVRHMHTYIRLHSFKLHKVIICSSSWRSEVQCGSHSAKIRCQQDRAPTRVSRSDLFLGLFQLLEAAHILWLEAPFGQQSHHFDLCFCPHISFFEFPVSLFSI